jgi:Protein of unknown function DUF58
MTKASHSTIDEIRKPIEEAIASALPAIIMDARRAAASVVIGEHGKRRAGIGDGFWQYREWVNGESVKQIDWRRSARSDKLFIREREHQVPALMQIWCDCRPNMDWRGGDDRPTKAARALMLGLSIAIAARAGGEQVCALGEPRRFNDEMVFAHALWTLGQTPPVHAKAGQVLIISDGLESPEQWAQRARMVANARAQLMVTLLRDRAEAEFPFQGRNLFQSPGYQSQVMIGRAQSAQSDYKAAYQAHFDAVRLTIKSYGGHVFDHVTSASAMPVLQILASTLNKTSPHRGGA